MAELVVTGTEILEYSWCNDGIHMSTKGILSLHILAYACTCTLYLCVSLLYVCEYYMNVRDCNIDHSIVGYTSSIVLYSLVLLMNSTLHTVLQAL